MAERTAIVHGIMGDNGRAVRVQIGPSTLGVELAAPRQRWI